MKAKVITAKNENHKELGDIYLLVIEEAGVMAPIMTKGHMEVLHGGNESEFIDTVKRIQHDYEYTELDLSDFYDIKDVAEWEF